MTPRHNEVVIARKSALEVFRIERPVDALSSGYWAIL